MRRHLLLFIITILAVNHPTFAGKKLKVLFIGNSYTYVNDLPQITADISASMGDTLIFDSYAVGAYTLFQHSIDPICAQKLASAQWDYVVLQEQSFAPAEQPHDFVLDSYYGALNMDHLIQANDSCTRVMFYMTWGYKNGVPDYCSDVTWPYPCTYEGMDSLVNLRYRAYADSNVFATIGYPTTPIDGFHPIRPALISPVGAVRHYIRDHYPAIELYQADGSHPTPAGSYAGACTFYAALFHKDPTLIPYNYALDSTDAANIKNAAKLITYDSLGKWHIGIDLRAQFTFTQSTGTTLSFTNTSTSATDYSWDFGDGNTSVLPDPAHTYSASGSYVVRLIAINASCSDTTFATINTATTGIANVSNANPDLIVSPNPVRDLLNLHFSKHFTGSCQLSIVNTLGQQIYFKDGITADQQINMSGFNSGIYFFVVRTGGSVISEYKILKL